MSGRIRDIATLSGSLPTHIVIDANLVVARFLATVVPSVPIAAVRAEQLFTLLRKNGTTAVLTPMVFTEVVHLVIKAMFQGRVPFHQDELATRFVTRRRYGWQHLYKVRSDFLEQFMPEIECLQRLLRFNRVLVFPPPDGIQGIETETFDVALQTTSVATNSTPTTPRCCSKPAVPGS